jgi:hypothetical protein
MSRSTWCRRATLLIVVLFTISVPINSTAQSSASISGTVKDTDGSVLPGVAVTVKNDTTGAQQEVTTDAQGAYQITALGAGTYTVTAALSGFKTAAAKSVSVAPGQPVSIPLTLEIGQLEETVVVMSSAELVNTQNGTVAATLNADQLTRMPTPTRNALNAVAFLPGVNTSSSNRNSSINGLPESFLSITLDGVSNNDNFNRNTDGFFASITPRQDAVEAVAVTLSAGGAQIGGGSGAVTMAFQTRSGGNRFTGSVYEYYRNPKFNSNYVFNEINHLPKNQVKLHTFGGRAGGPIVIPGLYDGHNQAFFFFHYEQIRFPNTFTRTRTVFNRRVLDGFFRYNFGSEVREVNMLQLAANNGQIAAKDPTMTKLLGQIESAMLTTGQRAAQSDPLYDNYVWQSPSELFEHQPTMRLDYNLSDRHRLNGSFSTIVAKRTPDYLNNTDPRFPGAPNARDFKSTRPLIALAMRSVLTPNIVNEVRGGLTAFKGASNFGYSSDITSANDPSTFADSNGFAISAPANTITNWFTSNGPSWRSAPTYSLEDTLTWNRRAHTITAGGSFMISNASSSSQTMVRGITLGTDPDFDPAASLFTAANFAGASSAQLTAARNAFAVLTGRVASVTSSAVLDASGKYLELAPQTLEGGYKVFGSFVQDTWRLTPTITLTGGLRYDVTTPFVPSSATMSAVTMDSICGRSGLAGGGDYDRCNFLSAGSLGGRVPEFVLLESGTQGYKTDLNNVAPSGSVAWRPNVQSGFMRALLGDPEQATLRAGYSEAYDRQGLTRFTSLYGGNRGASLTLTRNAATGLVPAGQSWPVLLSQPQRLLPLTFNPDPTYPIAPNANRADSLNAFTPDIQAAHVRTWTVGFARSLSKDMAFEIRYIGNRGDHEWEAINYNCLTTGTNGCGSIRGENLVANGFMNEFKQAMANLKANNTSGVSSRVGSFAYFGSGTGTVPLPIYLAYLNGSRDVNNPAAYANAANTWANATIAGRLAAPNPNPNSAAADLDTNATRRTQAQALGYPANFFVVNPDVNNVNVTNSDGFRKYNALQLELRRRLSQGFSANVNYGYAFEGSSSFDGFGFGRSWNQLPVNTDEPTVRHALKFQADWILPFGRGERFGGSMGALANALVGGWSVTAVGRFQRTVEDFGNVRLVGMSQDELQSVYKFYRKGNPSTGIDEIWMLPDDIVLNTRAAFSTVNTTADGYSLALGAPVGRYIAPANSADCIQVRDGDCATRNLLLLSPWFKRVDFGVAKKVGIGGARNFEVRFDMLNIFDSPNFTTVSDPGSGSGIFRTTSAYTDPSNTYDPGGRVGQLSVRFSW